MHFVFVSELLTSCARERGALGSQVTVQKSELRVRAACARAQLKDLSKREVRRHGIRLLGPVAAVYQGWLAAIAASASR